MTSIMQVSTSGGISAGGGGANYGNVVNNNHREMQREMHSLNTQTSRMNRHSILTDFNERRSRLSTIHNEVTVTVRSPLEKYTRVSQNSIKTKNQAP